MDGNRGVGSLEETLEELQAKLNTLEVGIKKDTRMLLNKDSASHKVLTNASKDLQNNLCLQLSALKARIAAYVASRMFESERVNRAVVKAKSGGFILCLFTLCTN